jgi:hypothetical protein
MRVVRLSDIPEFRHFPDYGITDTGQVLSIKNPNKQIVLHQYKLRKYNIVYLYNSVKLRKSIMVGRLVASAFIPNLKKAKVIRYKNGNTDDCSVENLEWYLPARKVKKRRKRRRVKKKIRRTRRVRAKKVVQETTRVLQKTYYTTEIEITETIDDDENLIPIEPMIMEKFRQLYKAGQIKGYNMPEGREFFHTLLETAIDNFANEKGLRKILYAMENGQL